MPEPEAKFHQHPRNIHDQLYGRRLVDGDVLEANDAYTSSNGFWEKCTCPGVPLQGTSDDPIWVRPERPPDGTIYFKPEPANPPERYPLPRDETDPDGAPPDATAAD